VVTQGLALFQEGYEEPSHVRHELAGSDLDEVLFMFCNKSQAQVKKLSPHVALSVDMHEENH
jgi:hypothetical protein